jgi:hypothetical protein
MVKTVIYTIYLLVCSSSIAKGSSQFCIGEITKKGRLFLYSLHNNLTCPKSVFVYPVNVSSVQGLPSKFLKTFNDISFSHAIKEPSLIMMGDWPTDFHEYTLSKKLKTSSLVLASNIKLKKVQQIIKQPKRHSSKSEIHRAQIELNDFKREWEKSFGKKYDSQLDEVGLPHTQIDAKQIIFADIDSENSLMVSQWESRSLGQHKYICWVVDYAKKKSRFFTSKPICYHIGVY